MVPIDPEPFLLTAGLLYAGPWVGERFHAVGDHLGRHPADADPTVARIIGAAEAFRSAEAFAAFERLAALRRRAEATWTQADVLLLPTAACHPTPAEVAADPVGVNSRLGRFTNFANLLDTCAIAVPSAAAGVTLFAPAWHDQRLAALGAALTQGSPVPPPPPLALAVFGAHLRGQPLHRQLLDAGARFLDDCRTAPDYRMIRIPPQAGLPERPGLVGVVAGSGAAIAGELYAIDHAGLGRMLSLSAPPLALGRIRLADGQEVTGYLATTTEGDEITRFGSWRAFLGIAPP